MHTSRLATGFSINTKCVSFEKCLSGSRSASSAKLFEVRTSAVRFGIEVARLACMLLTRFRARSRVCRRGEKGKFERAVISLSVKSIASWSCSPHELRSFPRNPQGWRDPIANLCNAQVFNGWYSVACVSPI